MNQEFLLSFAKQAILVAACTAGPMLLIGMVIGIMISMFQAVTQINEMTLTFIPKIIATALGGIIFGPWMLEKMLDFTTGIFTNLVTYIK